MKTNLVSMLLSFLTLAVGVLPSPAHACWDGLRAHDGHGVVVVYPYGGGEGPDPEPLPTWSPAKAREFAQLLPRLAQVAGEGSWVYASPWEIEVCVDDRAQQCVRQESLSLASSAEILTAVGSVVGASPETMRAARALSVPVWTLEVGAPAAPQAAADLATRINRLDADVLHGNVEIGGFPASNAVAHLLPAPNGQVQVVVGTFIDPEGMAAARTLLRETLAVESTARSL